VNAGTATIDWLYREQLRVDAQWSERDTNGFTWWADKNAQRIEVVRRDSDPELGESFLIRVRTEMLCDLTLDDRALKAIGAALMPFASMAGPVYDAASRRLSLSSMVRVHEEIRVWMAPLISMAAVLQVGEARIVGPKLPELIGCGRFATSGHPHNGLRPKTDEMAEIIPVIIAPLGQKPSAWIGPEFEEAVKGCMMRPPSLGATSVKDGLTVEFPYGDCSSLCQMKADQTHPRYGHGLHLRQSFPVKVTDELAGIRLALELNSEELETDAAGYGFGSYCYRDQTIHFCTFFPNAVYRPKQLTNLYFSCATRAKRMAQRFCNDDWSNLSDRTSAVERIGLLGRLARRIGRK